jgi:signal transduction histidine kinase
VAGGCADPRTTSTPRPTFDSWLTRRYERDPRRHVAEGLWLIFVLASLVAVLGASAAGQFLAVPIGPLLLLDAGVVLLVGLAVWVGVRASRPELEVIAASMASGHVAPGTAAVARRLASKVISTAGVRGAVIVAPVATALLNLLSDRSNAASVAMVFIGALMIVASCTLFGYFGGEVWLRPLRADLSRREVDDRPVRKAGVAAKLLVALLSMILFAALAAGAFMEDEGSGASGLGRLYVVTLAAGATIGVVGTLLLSRIVLSPIEDLTVATQAVMRGELDTRVPITATDELGELAHRFNDMVTGLRERETLRDDLRESRSRLVAAADAERRRMERDLHDGAQQHLVLMRLQLGMVEKRLGNADPLVGELRATVDQALADLRDLAHGIYPPALESEGLTAALSQAGARFAIPVSVEGDAARFPREIEAAVYFCCLEALQNAAKHGGPEATASVTVSAEDDSLEFAVADTGPGFDPATQHGSQGLDNMRDRIGALGGSLVIESAPGRGTTVTGTVPTPRRAA